MDKINIALEDMRVMQDANRHVALEYYRGTSKSNYIGFSPSGVARFEESTANLLKDFDKPLSDKPLCAQVLSFMKYAKSAYLPNAEALETLVDIFLMCRLGSESGPSMVSVEDLWHIHCELTPIVQRHTLDKFKNRDEAEAELYELRASVYTPTERQEQNRNAQLANAARRLSGLTEASKAPKAEREAAKREKVAGKMLKTPRKQSTSSGGGSKGQGIGAYCCGLILSGKTNEETLALALTQFPGAKTSLSSVNWYRNDLKKKGQLK